MRNKTLLIIGGGIALAYLAQRSASPSLNGLGNAPGAADYIPSNTAVTPGASPFNNSTRINNAGPQSALQQALLAATPSSSTQPQALLIKYLEPAEGFAKLEAAALYSNTIGRSMPRYHVYKPVISQACAQCVGCPCPPPKPAVKSPFFNTQEEAVAWWNNYVSKKDHAPLSASPKPLTPVAPIAPAVTTTPNAYPNSTPVNPSYQPSANAPVSTPSKTPLVAAGVAALAVPLITFFALR